MNISLIFAKILLSLFRYAPDCAKFHRGVRFAKQLALRYGLCLKSIALFVRSQPYAGRPAQPYHAHA